MVIEEMRVAVETLLTFFMLMFAATLLVGLAQKIHIPYPLALVIGGTVIGFIPGLQSIDFDPTLILVIVLPPILYYAAFGISFREFKRNWSPIFSLALSLVFVTTLVVGVIFKWLFPQFPWALAFAFGAIVSPPDAVAATSILRRFAIGPRLLSILEGESLINDASALVLYRLAVTALLSGAFSLSEASLEFVKVVSGGVILGLVLGLLLQWFSRRYLEPVVGVVFSFTIPYITFIAADLLGVSGVLAVVVNGLVGSKILLTHHSSLRRVLGYSTWDIFIILMNCFVFILIGLQLRTITMAMTLHQMMLYSAYAALITSAMIAIRMAWVYAKSGFAYVKALKEPKSSTHCPQILREAALIGWSGMRGIVSLAAALGLPYHLPTGMPLQGRSEVIFITFVVILLTLLLPGFSLSSLVTWLKIRHHTEHVDAQRVRKQLVDVAKEKIHELHSQKQINDEELDFLTAYFHLQRQVLGISTSPHRRLQNLESIRHNVIQAQRKRLFEMWEQLEIDDTLFAHLEHELDVEETHLARAELK